MWAAFGLPALVTAMIVLAVLPLRGGTGQHAGAGPGALSVWQLRRRRTELSSPPEQRTEPLDAEIGWPADDPDAAPAHPERLLVDCVYRPFIASRLVLALNFPRCAAVRAGQLA